MRLFSSRKKQRILHSWEDLSDGLISFRNAQEINIGSDLCMEFEVVWKAEKRRTRVRVTAVEDSALGLIAHIDALLSPQQASGDKTPELFGQEFTTQDIPVLSRKAAEFSLGGIAHSGSQIVYRCTYPCAGIPFAQLDEIITRVASIADDITDELSDDIQNERTTQN